MTTPTPPKRRNKANTPSSESKILIFLDEDDKEFKTVMEAARSPSFLSPKGKELVKQAMKSSSPLDLESINRSVVAHDIEKDWIKQDDNKKPSPTKANTNLTQEDNKKKGNRENKRALEVVKKN